MVVQSAFFIPLFAGVAVALPGEAAKAGFSVRRIFLAVDKTTDLIQDQTAAAQMVTQVILYCGTTVVWMRDTHAH
jgi:hypothetical protein